MRNKAYIGIKVYKVKGEERSARAVWPAIIDEITFQKVQEIMKKNFRRYRPHDGIKYPFPLSGILQCGTCGERMCGKTAHGNGGKIPYYEHAWATKRQACLVSKVFSCDPNRVLAKVIEPEVWSIIEKVLCDPKQAQSLLDEAHAAFAKKSRNAETERHKAKVTALERQGEALAARIAELPKTLSAAPFYKQMAKIESLKKEEEARLSEAELATGPLAEPSSVKSFTAFIAGLRAMANDPLACEIRKRIIHKLVSRIEVKPGTFRLHFHVGGHYVDRELAHAGSQLLPLPKRRQHFFGLDGSNTVDSGVPTGIVARLTLATLAPCSGCARFACSRNFRPPAVVAEPRNSR